MNSVRQFHSSLLAVFLMLNCGCVHSAEIDARDVTKPVASDSLEVPKKYTTQIIRVNERRCDLAVFSEDGQELRGIPHSRNAQIWGQKGAVLSTDRKQLALHTGRILVKTASEPLSIRSRFGTIHVKDSSSIILDCQPHVLWLALIIAKSPDSATIERKSQHAIVVHSVGDSVAIDDQALNLQRGKVNFNELAKQDDNLLKCSKAGALAGKGDAVRVLAEASTEFSYSGTTILLRSGEIFLQMPENMTVTTPLGVVSGASGALLGVEWLDEALRVKSCSQSGRVWTFVDQQKIVLNPGQELLVTRHRPTTAELQPSDGVGRRKANVASQANGVFTTVSEYSIISWLHGASYLSVLLHEDLPQDKRILDQILKTASAVLIATQQHGSYSASARKRVHSVRSKPSA
jgi:hypothetical protein